MMLIFETPQGVNGEAARDFIVAKLDIIAEIYDLTINHHQTAALVSAMLYYRGVMDFKQRVLTAAMVQLSKPGSGETVDKLI